LIVRGLFEQFNVIGKLRMPIAKLRSGGGAGVVVAGG
jgi:hypothetical protein